MQRGGGGVLTRAGTSQSVRGACRSILSQVHTKITCIYRMRKSQYTRRDKCRDATRDVTRDAIVELNQHLFTLEKKQDYLNQQIADDTHKAKTALILGGSNGERIASNA